MVPVTVVVLVREALAMLVIVYWEQCGMLVTELWWYLYQVMHAYNSGNGSDVTLVAV